MAQLYDRSLMLSIAIQNAPFSLIVPISHSQPLAKALIRFFQNNMERPHSGRHCYGKTPWQTFLDSKHIALAKYMPHVEDPRHVGGGDTSDNLIDRHLTVG